MEDFTDIGDIAKKITEKVLSQIDNNNISISQFEKIITELKQKSIDYKIITELETVINDSTQRNKRLAELIKKGGEIGKILLEVCSLVIK